MFVVYFDQLSGTAGTLKLVELLFSAVFNLFCEREGEQSHVYEKAKGHLCQKETRDYLLNE